MKTEHSRVASTYAEAVIELAYAGGDTTAEQIGNDLKAINQVVADAPDFTMILNHPAIGSAAKKQLLLEIFGGKVNELTMRLLNLLADKRRLELLAHIEQQYAVLLRARKNIVTARLTSAEPLPDTTVAGIRAKLAAKLGKQIEIEVLVDRQLIGGLVLRVGDKILDGSLKGKLKALERSLLCL